MTGAFEGIVTASLTGQILGGVKVEIINQEKGVRVSTRTDSRGRFYWGLLTPGLYTIVVSLEGYQTRALSQSLEISRIGEVVPVPIALDPIRTTTTAPSAPFNPTPASSEIRASVNTTDARRSRSFPEEDTSSIPLGASTFSRSFDQLTLLAPGVAPPPQTLGSVAGPGVGAGVGTAGQFAVNGLRSRANNFTVDGSDNNDEDIGVRRQGFISLIPQPVESVREYHAITLLAPAQFGRNIGAQINVISKSGGNTSHGILYGFLNASNLNARNYFDTTNGNAITALHAGNNQAVLLDGEPLRVRNQSGGKDSFTTGAFGGTLGGPVRKEKLFYFLSAEGQIINARQEESFSVPTVEQRGAFRTGATGIFSNPITGVTPLPCATGCRGAVPSSPNGDAVFSLFPFPNNPGGIFGANTFTQALPASARGLVTSLKLDDNFKIRERQQSVTGRYNFTDDWREIPATGAAVFSTLRPEVRAQNLSLYLNSQLGGPDAINPLFNQLRLSYGRTRLRFRPVIDQSVPLPKVPGRLEQIDGIVIGPLFDSVRDRDFPIASRQFPATPFLLNKTVICNRTLPASPGVPNTGNILFSSRCNPFIGAISVEEEIGPTGQVIVAGFSPVGVDVYNFPQRRVNNTYQLADNLTWHREGHNLTFGFDLRRTELNNDLPRVSRPLIVFNGGPLPANNSPNRVVRPEDFVALGAASSYFLTLNNGRDDANINLRFNQLNFFGQDEWRVNPQLSISYGLRYEYNTPPGENNGLIEQTFNDPALDLVPGLRTVIDGRTRIFDPDRNNIAPRISLAFSPKRSGRDQITVIRAGYGLYYDQIPGAVVSQSRNVFPSFLTLNFGGLDASSGTTEFGIINPAVTVIGRGSVVQPGTLNRLNPLTPLGEFISSLESSFPSALGVTLPRRHLAMPGAQHYSFSIEQQFGRNYSFSAAYVGTRGHNLLRFTTPNLGPGLTVSPTVFGVVSPDNETFIPRILGLVNDPRRPIKGIGAVNIFETTGSSGYDSLQLVFRGHPDEILQFFAAYTLSRTIDDVSDVFDLAGAYALPQNSLTFAGERGAAGFDALHRLAYNLTLDFSAYASGRSGAGRLLDGLQLTGVGRYQTGLPFTVNSILDVNLDGNLTDRLNTTAGLQITGDRSQPLRLTTADPLSLLAPFGRDGKVARNSFRAGSSLEFDLAVLKNLTAGPGRKFSFRAEVFNLFNRPDFGIPVRLLEAPGFGKATNTITPGRRVQFSLKYNF
ncbi:MAG TPA: TonB-dependent receptor [Blastocatellia bacterium]|nr:TonB-dependent receptor [Blastocatellia bacterium]